MTEDEMIMNDEDGAALGSLVIALTTATNEWGKSHPGWRLMLSAYFQGPSMMHPAQAIIGNRTDLKDLADELTGGAGDAVLQ